MTPRRRAAASSRPPATELWYVYGVVPATAAMQGAPSGLDEAPVESVPAGELAALVSVLDGARYTPEIIESRIGEVEWIAPRAKAHDDVVTWASQPGPVVPLHMWTLFADRDGVTEMLERRAAELAPVLKRLAGCDEYGLRVFADSAALEARASETDPKLAALESDTAQAPPGQSYLLGRKLEKQRRDAARAYARRIAGDVHGQLAKQATATARDTIPNPSTPGAAAILAAAYLIRRERLQEFRRALTELVREHEPRGLRFEFTGPWPAYHFVAGAPANAAQAPA